MIGRSGDGSIGNRLSMMRQIQEQLSFLRRGLGSMMRAMRDHYAATGDLGRAIRYGTGLARSNAAILIRQARARVSAPGFARYVDADTASSRADRALLVAVCVTGGVGDYIVVARFLRDLAALSKHIRFDIYCANAAAADLVFTAMPQHNRTYAEPLFWHFRDKYVVALRASQFVIVHDELVQWDQLVQHEQFVTALRTLIEFRSSIEHFVARHPHLDNQLAQKAVSLGFTRENFMHGMAHIKYGGPRYELSLDAPTIARFGLPARYMTINNGFDGSFMITGRTATKTYPHSAALAARFKARYPGVAIVQLGTSTSQPIPSADFNLINQTSMAEAAAIVRDAALHIDNEGGLVHVASCYGVRAAVIFGPTAANYFAYPGNINLGPPACGNCWWSSRSWMDVCPRGDAKPRCMFEQTPEVVLDAISASWSPTDVTPRAKSTAS